MLELLTEYLTKTNRVSIPGIGALRLERQPATWNVVDQELLGPVYRVHAADESGEPGDGQLSWLAGAAQQSEPDARERLEAFGRDLRQQLQSAPFLWPGVGLLQWQEGRLEVAPAVIGLPSLAAPRVIREDARHTIRVGEQEVASNFYEERTVAPERRNDLEWLAWLIAFLAALAVFYFLYSEGFSPLGSGLKTTVFNNLP